MSAHPQLVEVLAGHLRAAKNVLFVTGAGLSADSGLPTYRGVGGLYEHGHTHEGVPIEVALSGPMMARNPDLTWKYIRQIEAACRGARPNRAHYIMAELERTLQRCWVLTQNVDGFHLAAGSTNVIEIHGNLHRIHCMRCDWGRSVTDYRELDANPEAGELGAPQCPRCRGLLRPQVVLFGELLPAEAIEALRRELTAGFDVVVTVGTSAAFPYIAEPVLAARRRGAVTIEVNPGQSEISDLVDVRIPDRALTTFEALATALDMRH